MKEKHKPISKNKIMTKTINASGVGNAIDRVEGHLKVMGKAKYASEFPVENKVYGQGINSTIAKGEIISIDTSEAEKLEGVLKVITYKNAEKLKTLEGVRPELATDSIAPVLQSNKGALLWRICWTCSRRNFRTSSIRS